MAEQLAHSGADFELHYCARSSERAAFVERLKASPFADRVFLHFDEQPDTRLDAAKVLAHPRPTCTCMSAALGGSCSMCSTAPGPRAGGRAVCTVNTSPRRRWTPVPTGAFQVKLGSSGQVFDVPADKTVVQVLESHGIEIALSCEQGICGTCLTRVLEGVPEHRDLFLTEEEQAAQRSVHALLLARRKSPLLVLDL